MTSSGENETLQTCHLPGHFVEFEQCFFSKSDHFTGNLGANMIEHISEMELYIILLTLEKFECRNLTYLITKYQWVKQCQVHSYSHSSYRQAFQTQNKYLLIILPSSTSMPHPKELICDTMTHPKESSMLKVNIEPSRGRIC